jgi:hypothetical protein
MGKAWQSAFLGGLAAGVCPTHPGVSTSRLAPQIRATFSRTAAAVSGRRNPLPGDTAGTRSLDPGANLTPLPPQCYFCRMVFRTPIGRARLVLACLLFTLLAIPALAQDLLRINEFAAVNGGILPDENGDDSDWIELYNAGTNTVDLTGWFLTDNAANLTKWKFPTTNQPPNSYLIVFASGKNRRVPGAPLHSNFKLGASGGYLGLVKPDGLTVV